MDLILSLFMGCYAMQIFILYTIYISIINNFKKEEMDYIKKILRMRGKTIPWYITWLKLLILSAIPFLNVLIITFQVLSYEEIRSKCIEQFEEVLREGSTYE